MDENVWKMKDDEFFYYLINKEKKTKCYKEQKDLLFLLRTHDLQISNFKIHMKI